MVLFPIFSSLLMKELCKQQQKKTTKTKRSKKQQQNTDVARNIGQLLMCANAMIQDSDVPPESSDK